MPAIKIKYYHLKLKIGLENIREAWLLSNLNEPLQLKPAVHQGNLYYRLPGSGKRISYHSIKKGLVKKKIDISLPEQLLPF